MQQGYSGEYFIGTKNRGLFRIDDSNSTKEKQVPGFLSLEIRSIWPESAGVIWICTYGNGFFLLENEKLTQFPQNGGMLSYVHYIINAGKGYLWLPSNNGLFVASKRALFAYARNKASVPFYYRFTRKTGLRTNEFNGATIPAYITLQNGQVSLSTMNGLVQFNPTDIHTNFSSEPIVLGNIQLDSNEVSMAEEIDIKSQVKVIRLHISTSFWEEKENEILEYRISRIDNPGDAQWSPVDESGIISFFSLSHGNYQVMLRKRTGLEENDFLYKQVVLHVSPKWYQTTVFGISAYLAYHTAAIRIFLLAAKIVQEGTLYPGKENR
jgi:hypothetical protein